MTWAAFHEVGAEEDLIQSVADPSVPGSHRRLSLVLTTGVWTCNKRWETSHGGAGRVVRRVGAAGMALAAMLVLVACRATGGGYIGDPLDGEPVGVYQGDAEFGFDFTCEMETTKKKPRAVIRGEITYRDSPSSITLEGDLEPTLFPQIRLHGTVEPLIVPNVPSCEEAVEGLPAALFEGTYRSQDRALRSLRGEFVVQVFARASRAARKRRSPGTASPSSSSGALTTAIPGAATSRAATSRWSRSASYQAFHPAGAPLLPSHQWCSSWFRLEKLTSFGRDGTTETARVTPIAVTAYIVVQAYGLMTCCLFSEVFQTSRVRDDNFFSGSGLAQRDTNATEGSG